MPFWRCFYHVIWTTKNREPLITAQIESVVFASARNKATMLGSQIYAINSVEDHIHIVFSMPPKIAAAQWIKHVKGVSSYDVNTHFQNISPIFHWQSSYGVLTLGAKALPFVIDYVNDQKLHHANNTLEPYMEQIDEDED